MIEQLWTAMPETLTITLNPGPTRLRILGTFVVFVDLAELRQD